MENNKMDKSKIFRFNMCIIQGMYKNYMKEIALKYKADISWMGNNCLYHIMHTTREDYSKYKNGKITKVRDVMYKKLTGELPAFDQILTGNKLIKTGNINERWVQDRENLKPEQLIPQCEEETAQLVKNTMREIEKVFSSEQSGIESKLAVWMGEKISIYWEANSGVDNKLNTAAKYLQNISVEEISMCSDEILMQANKVIKKKAQEINTIAAYRSIIRKKGER